MNARAWFYSRSFHSSPHFQDQDDACGCGQADCNGAIGHGKPTETPHRDGEVSEQSRGEARSIPVQTSYEPDPRDEEPLWSDSDTAREMWRGKGAK